MHQSRRTIANHPAVPAVTDINRPYWRAGAESVLRLPFCGACERWFFPPAAACPACGGAAGFRATSGDGVVYTFTVSAQQFHPEVATPFVVAIVELDDQPGLRIPANISGCAGADVSIGLPVTVSFDPVASATDSGQQVFVPVFVPTLARPH